MPESAEATTTLMFAVVGLMFFAGGMLLVTAGRKTTRARKAFAARATRTTGDILEVRWENRPVRPNDSGSVARLRLRHQPAGGPVTEAWSFEASSLAGGREGDRIDVLYDPDSPELVGAARDNLAFRVVRGCLAAMGGLIAIVGLVLLAVAGLLLLV